MLEFCWSAILAKARSLHHQDGWFVYTTNERCWKCHGYIVFHNLLRVQAKVWVSLKHNFGISQMSHGCCCNFVECWERLRRLSWLCQSVTCRVRSDDHNMSAHCRRVFSPAQQEECLSATEWWLCQSIVHIFVAYKTVKMGVQIFKKG